MTSQNSPYSRRVISPSLKSVALSDAFTKSSLFPNLGMDLKSMLLSRSITSPCVGLVGFNMVVASQKNNSWEQLSCLASNFDALNATPNDSASLMASNNCRQR